MTSPSDILRAPVGNMTGVKVHDIGVTGNTTKRDQRHQSVVIVAESSRRLCNNEDPGRAEKTLMKNFMCAEVRTIDEREMGEERIGIRSTEDQPSSTADGHNTSTSLCVCLCLGFEDSRSRCRQYFMVIKS